MFVAHRKCSNCEAEFEDQHFCPECGQWVDPLQEAEYEEFTLGDTPAVDEEQLRPIPAAPTSTQYVNCPSCGAANPAHNRHCEECGARIGQGPLPVAPQPLIRTTAGARALAVILAAVAVVALLAWGFNSLFGGDDTSAENTTTSSTNTTLAAAPIKITPLSATCSSNLNETFDCSNLIDGTERYWNDASAQGRDATVDFVFSEPIAIEQIIFKNVTDDAAFRRNFRVRGFEVTTDDLPDRPIIDQLDDSNRSQLVEVASLRTRQLTFKVTSTYPAEAVGGETPFNELAIDEIEFYGRPASG